MLLKAPLERVCNTECDYSQPDADFALRCDARRQALIQDDFNPGSSYCATARKPILVSEAKIEQTTGVMLTEHALWANAAHEVATQRTQEVK